MNSAMPVFKKDNLQYERDEREGYYTFIPRMHPETRELIINKTSKRILDLCDGNNTLTDIGAAMRLEYPDVDPEVILSDVMKTVGSLSRIAVVTWIGENPFVNYDREPLGERYSMGVAQERDIRKILAFVERHYPDSGKAVSSPPNLFVYWSPDGHGSEYAESALRSKLFSFSEEFLMLYCGDEVAGMVGIEPPSTRGAVSSVRLVISPEECLIEFVEYAVSIFPRLTDGVCTKYRLIVLSGQPGEDHTVALLKNAGFHFECALNDEIGPGLHVAYYVRGSAE